MRKTKFRGLNKEGKWVCGNLTTGIYKGGWVTVIQEEIEDENVPMYKSLPIHIIFDSNTIGQFTGLFDDDGKEIYNGDIVEIQNAYETKTSYISQVYLTCNGVLVSGHPSHIKAGHEGYRLLSEFCDYGCGGMYHVRCKIKGNIYEDSNLLEGNING